MAALKPYIIKTKKQNYKTKIAYCVNTTKQTADKKYEANLTKGLKDRLAPQNRNAKKTSAK